MSCTARCTLTLFSLLVDWKRLLTAGKDGTIVFETISFHPFAKHHQTFAEHLNSSKAPCSHWTSQFIIHTICYSCLRAVTAHGPRCLQVSLQHLRSCDMRVEGQAGFSSMMRRQEIVYYMNIISNMNTGGGGGGGGFVKLLGKCREWNSGHWVTSVVVQGTWRVESTINILSSGCLAVSVVVLSNGNSDSHNASLSLSIWLWNCMSYGHRHRGIHESLQPLPNVQYEYFLPADWTLRHFTALYFCWQ